MEASIITHLHPRVGTSAIIQSMDLLTSRDDFGLLYRLTYMDFLVLEGVSLLRTCILCRKYFSIYFILHMLYSFVSGRSSLCPPSSCSLSFDFIYGRGIQISTAFLSGAWKSTEAVLVFWLKKMSMFELETEVILSSAASAHSWLCELVRFNHLI